MTQPQFVITARQQLTASPQLQQAVRLLQMSTLELEQELRDALANNPFLEECASPQSAEPVTPGTADPGAASAAGEAAPAAAESATADGGSYDAGSAEYRDEYPGSDYSLRPDTAAARGGRFEDEPDSRDWAGAGPNLREHLREQLCSQRYGARERLALAVVIETLDDDGYLRGDPAESAAALDLDEPLTAAELEAAVRALQDFDPVGVGARSLEECLTRQLAALPAATPGRDLALTIVGNHLPLLARRDEVGLCRRLDCSSEALRRARALIVALDPKPGDSFAPAHAGYVTPDVLVTIHKGRLRVVANPDVLPRARLNRAYVDLLRRSRDQANPALNQALQEARCLLRNTEQRFDTIRRVAESIVQRQRAFFVYGDLALKPMALRDVAAELGLHESTVSRATCNKYMATPRGTFEFKHFFSRPLSTDTGGSCSAAAVRALIQELVDGERREQPLSDVELAHILERQGICVARRTVAKYRNQMKIPPAELRRHV